MEEWESWKVCLMILFRLIKLLWSVNLGFKVVFLQIP